jgi:heme exporter protein B
MSAIAHLTALMGKELRSEWKQKYALSGLLVYAITMVFIVGFSFRDGLSTPTWNIVFWIILLFLAVNAVARSFLSESRGQAYYLYGLASPALVIASRLLFSMGLMAVLSLITLFFYLVFANRTPAFDGDTQTEVQADMVQFAFVAIIGGAGFAANLTFVSAIAARARNAATLVAILGFPLMLPALMMSIQAGNNALFGHDWGYSSGELLFSGAYVALMACISLILFPFVWKD